MSVQLAGPFTVIVGEYPATDAELDTGLLYGKVLDVGLAYTFDGGSSMDVDIMTAGASSPQKDILHLNSANTDGWFAPRGTLVDTDGGAIADQYDQGIAVYDSVNIAISNATPGDQLDVWFLLEE